MKKTMLVITAAALSMLASGCALVSTHTAPVDGGTKTTVGLFGIDVVDNCYPILPIYVGYEQTK